jgi:hypothetical protein
MEPQGSVDRVLAGAVWAGVVGGSLLLAAGLLALPAAVAIAGLILFTASLLAVVILGVIVSRRDGVGIVRAVSQGLAFGVRWIFRLLPA